MLGKRGWMILGLGWVTLGAGAALTQADEPAPPFPVTIQVDAAKPLGALKPIWRFFGADEPNYAYMTDGQKLIGELGELKPKAVYFRTHNLLSSGDGTPGLKWGSTGAYSEDALGNPLYDWTITDRIFDTYLERGVKPYVQVGFMPREMSTHPDPYQHHWDPKAKYNDIFTGWAYPPKDYVKWGDLVERWVTHCVAKYGKAEVESWYWEVWNEANIGYWQGTPAEFRKLHDYAITAVRRALPTARVGGADSAGSGGKWTRDFLEHQLRGTNEATGLVGTPMDFISFHAKGSPVYVDGHVRMGIANQLRTIDDGFKIVASFPELKEKPIVIGESDPEGCAACQGPQLGYRNGTMYSSYTAAVFARKLDLAARRGVNLEGALTWAFEFEDQPLFAGFRVLASGGIDLPVLNVFRMMSRMGGERLPVSSSGAVALDAILKDGVRNQADVGALASLAGSKLSVLVWHYHDDDIPGPEAAVALEISGLPVELTGPVAVEHYRIDATHSNAFEAWKRLGSPAKPAPEQMTELIQAGQLARLEGVEAGTAEAKGNRLTCSIPLPRQAVALLQFELSRVAKDDAGR